jgi:hypothetical protein
MAQTPASVPDVSWLYGISFGTASRTTSGTLSGLPAGASQPPSRKTLGAIDVDGGLTFGRRIDVAADLQIFASGSEAVGSYGSTGVLGIVRIHPVGRLWIEGGAGVTSLNYEPPSKNSLVGVRYWAPQGEGAAGWELFRGDETEISLFARYSKGAFSGLTTQTFSVQLALSGRH